jgi:hypothetical protein
MSLKLNTLVKSFAFFAIVINFGISEAADCKTSSGSQCTVTCSQGTATATCSSNSKNCSTSCSDSSGNMEINLSNSLNIVTDGQIGQYEARKLFQYELPIRELQSYGGKKRFSAGYHTITVDVDPPN